MPGENFLLMAGRVDMLTLLAFADLNKRKRVTNGTEWTTIRKQ